MNGFKYYDKQLYLVCMKEISKSYLSRKINKLNKKIHRAEDQNEENKVWWRKMKLEKLKNKLKKIS